MKEKIRVGVLGAGRGFHFMVGAPAAGMELVAICDNREEKLEEAKKRFGIAGYSSFDDFLNHKMDAVVIANYFHEHAPFAIKALKAGKHVMSECTSAITMAECVELARTVERTKKIYMLAENYPYFSYTQEMATLYKKGVVGQALYAEGEYNHPLSAETLLGYSPGWDHWRLWMPATYYCTHALAPLMAITGQLPKSVNALAFPNREFSEKMVRFNDPGAVILVRTDANTVFRLFGIFTPGHSIWYRVHGTRGCMENTRSHSGSERVRILHEPWDLKPGERREMVYEPEFPEWAKKKAPNFAHGGGDFFTNWYFAQSIRSGKQPFFDVYKGTAMSAVAIQSWRSALENGKPFAIPDFSNEKERKIFEKDHWSPFSDGKRKAQAPSSVLGFLKWTPAMKRKARAAWNKCGFNPKPAKPEI